MDCAYLACLHKGLSGVAEYPVTQLQNMQDSVCKRRPNLMVDLAKAEDNEYTQLSCFREVLSCKLILKVGYPPTINGRQADLMLMLDLAKAENMVAETPFRLAICCPTAAKRQQWSIDSMWLMRPVLIASRNLSTHTHTCQHNNS